MSTTFQRGAHLLAIAALASVFGCAEKSTAPITDLSEEHKQQVQELQEQRASEWDSKKK